MSKRKKLEKEFKETLDAVENEKGFYIILLLLLTCFFIACLFFLD